METVITKFEAKYRKSAIPKVKSGDTVKVSQKVREAGKERVQLFEGMVIRTRRMGSLSASLTVRRIASGVGVEKTYLLHSPNLVKVQVIKRGKVRRNYLTYLRDRQGKATRLTEVGFDQEAVNVKEEPSLATKEETAGKEKESTKEAVEYKAEAKATKTEKADEKAREAKLESEPKSEEPTKPNKATEKKAKAEEFRKAQEAKKQE